MNKSVFLKNKIYYFFFLVFSFTMFVYLLYFLINGNKGIIAYHKINNEYLILKDQLFELEHQNNELEGKILRLTAESLDLDYLEEQLKLNTATFSENELIINLKK